MIVMLLRIINCRFIISSVSTNSIKQNTVRFTAETDDVQLHNFAILFLHFFCPWKGSKISKTILCSRLVYLFIMVKYPWSRSVKLANFKHKSPIDCVHLRSLYFFNFPWNCLSHFRFIVFCTCLIVLICHSLPRNCCLLRLTASCLYRTPLINLL